MPNRKTTITATEVQKYETLVPLIESLHSDVKELTRKNQNVALSKTKIQMINRLLAQAKTLLKDEPTASFLDLLDEQLIPQNADALLVLGQYRAALEQFRAAYTEESEYDDEESTWRIRRG